MATDYSKKKNAELEDLLRARSLPHTGKKADLIARLLQSDKDASHPPPTTSAKSSTATAVADDEIDWDDEKDAEKARSGTLPAHTAAPAEPEQSAPSAAGKAALAAGGQGQPANPPAVPNQLVAEDPSTTSDLTVIDPSTTEPEPAKPTASESATQTPTPAPAPAADFTQGLSGTSLDAELEKRKARAARFGLPVEGDSEAVKALERAKKFGTGVGNEGKVVVGGLDNALPERARKRGREGPDRGEEEKGAKRQDSRRRDGRGRGRGGRGGKGGGEGPRPAKSAGEGKKADGAKTAAGPVSEKDRLAAEARKKRFAAAA